MTTKDIFAIDPGNIESAYVILRDGVIIEKGKIENSDLLRVLKCTLLNNSNIGLFIEMVASYGMPVGREVFDTCVYIGRLTEAYFAFYGHVPELVFRKEIKMHHCGNMRAKDANIIQALKDKYGDKGTKKNPGYFFGVNADVWQAFALASYVLEKQAG